MFIVSAKIPPKKAIAYVVLCGLVLIVLILVVGRVKQQPPPGEETVVAATDAERTAYLTALGWAVSAAPIETLEFTLPQPLNASYEAYNELQQEQGFDLAPYAGMQVKRYSYQVTNYPDCPENVQANLYLCGDLVIGGDILCYGEEGFVDTLIFPG